MTSENDYQDIYFDFYMYYKASMDEKEVEATYLGVLTAFNRVMIEGM
jgi:hypothetical protein